MNLRFIIGLLVALGFVGTQSQAQIAGYWFGVTYSGDPNQVVHNYTMSIVQIGSTLSGTTANTNAPPDAGAGLSGQFALSTFQFSEYDIGLNAPSQGRCFITGTLIYNPVDESLIGTYQNIVNGTACTTAGSGKVELYRVGLKSSTTFCKGSPVNLVATGKNIRWYSSSAKTTLLATGNTFNPTISQTTTFYITQTLYNSESQPISVTVKIVDPTFTTVLTNAGCEKPNGSIAITATDSTTWQYSLNGGTYQDKPLFTDLSPGKYTVAIKDATGCRAEKSVTLSTDPAPTFSNLSVTSPLCATANGVVIVTPAGGRAPLTYSIDYGVTFQSSPIFGQLAGGDYNVRIRDANGCEVNKIATLVSPTLMTILNTNVMSTSCGQANGQLTTTIIGGFPPIQYSINSQPFQTDNTFNGLKAGNYTFVAKDNSGCTVSRSVTIAASQGPQIGDILTTPEACGEQNGTIVIPPGPTTDFIDFSLDGQAFQRKPNLTGLKAGSYTLTMKDNNNCVVTRTVVVPLDCPNSIHVPTAFSPNADQVDDVLTVYFRFPSLPISQFTVYDRWGAVVYNRANFVLLTGEPVWDGQVNGKPTPAGVYMYRLDCQFPDGTQATYRQSVYVLN